MHSYLSSVLKEFRRYELLGRNTMNQLSDEQLHFKASSEMNSVAVIVKHLHGNMMSRWTDFFIADGEKEWRNRDGEFIETLKTRGDILDRWDKGWKLVFETLEALEDDDLIKAVKIRGEEHTVIEAINRQMAHYSYHVGQMVVIARSLLGGNWKSLSIPRGKSEEFNRKLRNRGSSS